MFEVTGVTRVLVGFRVLETRRKNQGFAVWALSVDTHPRLVVGYKNMGYSDQLVEGYPITGFSDFTHCSAPYLKIQRLFIKIEKGKG